MFFFRVRKDTLDCLFPLLVYLLVLRYVSVFLGLFGVVRPDMPGHDFRMVPAQCALLPLRAGLADFRVALVFPVAFPVRGRVFQDLVFRAQIAVIVFVVHVLMLLEKTVFRHGALIRHYRDFPVPKDFPCDARRFVSRIDNDAFRGLAAPFQLFVQGMEHWLSWMLPAP